MTPFLQELMHQQKLMGTHGSLEAVRQSSGDGCLELELALHRTPDFLVAQSRLPVCQPGIDIAGKCERNPAHPVWLHRSRNRRDLGDGCHRYMDTALYADFITRCLQAKLVHDHGQIRHDRTQLHDTTQYSHHRGGHRQLCTAIEMV